MGNCWRLQDTQGYSRDKREVWRVPSKSWQLALNFFSYLHNNLACCSLRHVHVKDVSVDNDIKSLLKNLSSNEKLISKLKIRRFRAWFWLHFKLITWIRNLHWPCLPPLHERELAFLNKEEIKKKPADPFSMPIFTGYFLFQSLTTSSLYLCRIITV